MFLTPQGEVRVIGHRGAAALAPENTLASFRKAAALGVQWVEMDVSLLADGGTVIFHDEVLDRCTNGHGFLASQTMDTVVGLDAGSWFDPAYAGERIPDLRSALAVIQQAGMGLNLEIKHDGPGVEQLVDAVLATLATEWADHDSLLISSFNHQALQRCHRWAPHYRRGQLYEQVPSQWAEELAEIEAWSLHCNWRALDAALTRRIKAAGYRLLCYTVNNPLDVAAHWAWGMDAIFTDDPRQFGFTELVK